MAKVEDAPDEAYIKPSPLPTARSYPAFLNKLRSMVDDPSTDELICWSPSGKSIFILHPVRFSEELLPRFFLHRRFSSFVRQLNMYGFHKVPHLLTGALEPMSSSPPPSAFSPTARGKDEEKEDNMAISAFHTSGAVKEDDHDLSEFLHEYFQRDRPDLMQYVVRKRPAPGTSEKQAGKKHPRPSSGPSASSSVITPPEDPLSLPPLPPMSAAGKAHSADTPSMSTSTALTPYFASPYAPPGVPPALFDAILTANGLQGNPTAAAFLAASLAPSPPEASPGEKEFFSGDGNGGAGAAGLNANVASVLQTLQATQNDLVREVAHLRTAQQRLWADREQARRKERQHQDALERILRFLGGVFGAPAIQAAGHGQAQGQGKDQFAHLGLQDELDRMTGDKRQRTSPASNRRRGLLIEGPAGWEGEPSPLGREQDEHRFESVGPEEFGSASRFERLGSPHEDDAAASVGASMTVPTSRPSTKPTPAAAPTLSPSRPATPRLTAKQRGDVMSALSTDQMSNWLAQLVNAAASPRLGSASSPAGAEGRAGEASCALSQTDTQARAMQRSLATLTESLRQSSQAHAAQTIDDHSDVWAQGVAALQSPLPPQSNTPGPALPGAPKSGEDDLFAQFLTDNTHDDDPDMVFTPYPAATPPG